jgi:hypothetical protein
MSLDFELIRVELRGQVHCVRLSKHRLNEADQVRFGDELARLIAEGNCRRLVLGLGHDELDCLYSLFLGKLVSTRRLLLELGGHMHLAEVGPASLGVLNTCRLTDLFDIHADMDAAVAALRSAD